MTRQFLMFSRLPRCSRWLRSLSPGAHERRAIAEYHMKLVILGSLGGTSSFAHGGVAIELDPRGLKPGGDQTQLH